MHRYATTVHVGLLQARLCVPKSLSDVLTSLRDYLQDQQKRPTCVMRQIMTKKIEHLLRAGRLQARLWVLWMFQSLSLMC